MKTTNFITLPDGRKLAYAEFGKPDGYPVIHFHGNVSSRLEPLLLGDELISQSGLRLMAPDRPGMGQSDFKPNHGFSDYPKDIVFLADTAQLFTYPDEGHISIVINQFETIVKALKGDRSD